MSKDGLTTSHEKQTDLCPDCGAVLHIRNGKQGAFLGCTRYPECNYLRPLHEKNEIKKVLVGSSCPLCNKELVLQQGRYGLFVSCSAYPQCGHTAQLTEASSEDNSALHVACPICKKGKLMQRQSRYGKTFYACDNYPDCKYVLNDKPLNEFCPDCHWPITVERKTAASFRIICPKKGCGYRSKPI
ncbi:MAG: topoisomerase DNA-binding C4 zinc finger domain-containing protein [Psychromonas sp.]